MRATNLLLFVAFLPTLSCCCEGSFLRGDGGITKEGSSSSASIIPPTQRQPEPDTTVAPSSSIQDNIFRPQTVVPSYPPSTQEPSNPPSTQEPSNPPSTLVPSNPPSTTTQPSSTPSTSLRPSPVPSTTPTESHPPTSAPSTVPSRLPTQTPSVSQGPSTTPSAVPTVSQLPTNHPSTEPSYMPTTTPTHAPTNRPSVVPSHFPTANPSVSSRPTTSVAPSSGPSISHAPTITPPSPAPTFYYSPYANREGAQAPTSRSSSTGGGIAFLLFFIGLCASPFVYAYLRYQKAKTEGTEINSGCVMKEMYVAIFAVVACLGTCVAGILAALCHVMTRQPIVVEDEWGNRSVAYQ